MKDHVKLLRQLLIIWADFESRLLKVPIIKRVMNDELRLKDYHELLLNHYQQVIEGSRWIARAASSIDQDYLEIRSLFIKHASTEHRDYEMIKNNFLASGGKLEDFENSQKNIGTEALSAWMFHQASQKNPFDLIGAMFIIEGLGKYFAKIFANKIKEQLNLNNDQTSFYSYHAENDEEHLDQIEDLFKYNILDDNKMYDAILKTARVTGRLYLLQLEELGNY